MGTVPQHSVRIAGQQRPRKRLSTLHRGDFCPRDRSSGQRAELSTPLIPTGFPPFTNATSSQHEWQTPVVGPDGDPRPPECVRKRLPPARRRHIPPRANKRPWQRPSKWDGMQWNIISPKTTSRIIFKAIAAGEHVSNRGQHVRLRNAGTGQRARAVRNIQSRPDGVSAPRRREI